jgi:hypothetical protein
MAATIKGTTVVWSVNGLACSGLVSGVEQSFERSASASQKEILGDGGDCVTKVYSNAKADLSIELIPAARAAFPSIGTVCTVSGGTDMIGQHAGKYILVGGSQSSSSDGETSYSFDLEQYITTNLGA